MIITYVVNEIRGAEKLAHPKSNPAALAHLIPETSLRKGMTEPDSCLEFGAFMTCEMPQGSVIGPGSFTSGLKKETNSMFLKFTDNKLVCV